MPLGVIVVVVQCLVSSEADEQLHSEKDQQHLRSPMTQWSHRGWYYVGLSVVVVIFEHSYL
jgi:hypothetical protein